MLQEDKPQIFSWGTEVAVTTVLHYHATREKQQLPALIAYLAQTVLVQILRKAQTSILRSADYTGCANKKQSPRKKFYIF